MKSEKNSVEKLIRILFLLLGVLGLYFLVMAGSAPLRTLKKMNKQAVSDSLFFTKSANLASDSGLFAQARQKAYLNARINLAKNDSIGIIINLSDSLLHLSLKGVIIHTSHITELKTDPFLRALHPLAWLKTFSEPLVAEEEKTSIVKEPIVKKRAPKDTLEAMDMAFLPDTLVQNPAWFSMYFPQGLNLVLVQEQWVTRADKKVERAFQADIRRKRRSDAFHSAFHPGDPRYTPLILIKINIDDVRSIYRALPEKAPVVIGY